MNELLGLYPAWVEPGVGAGWVIGIIATIHVLFFARVGWFRPCFCLAGPTRRHGQSAAAFSLDFA